jgi:hypothetical protein
MIRTTAAFFALMSLSVAGPAALAETHGGAIPNNFSFYETAEFPDVQWASGRQGEPVWGMAVLAGGEGVRFVPDNGQEIHISYADIKSIRYERIVRAKEKKANEKWFQRPFAFAKGVDTIRTITLQHKAADGSMTQSVLKLDEVGASGFLRGLEIKTGLRTKRLSSL